MSADPAAPGARVLSLWNRLAPLPGGRRLFDVALGRMVPYTGKLGARVLELEPGRATVALAERRGVRNHLGSVHAVALANLGELATGLAVLTGLPPGTRGIVTRLAVDYRKKARGRLEARADPGVFDPPSEPVDRECSADIRDDEGDVVATVTATWRLAPR